MYTKSKNLKVEPEFEDLFSFSSKKEKWEHRAQMISYRILSEVEKICVEQNIKMKDLAALVETSPSYITQLFRGNKQVNTAFMARCEEAFSMMFDFSVQYEHKGNSLRGENNLLLDLQTLHVKHPDRCFYSATKGGAVDKTGQLLKAMEEEQKNSPYSTKQAV
jgi:transcriptional regulator with XRE-family HTH domain